MRYVRRVRTVFLLDVDNTLIDNDRLKADLAEAIARAVAAVEAAVFWRLYEEVRADEDVVDFPETVRRFRRTFPRGFAADRVAALVNDVTFRRYVYPGALAAVGRLWGFGTPVVLSDGDPVYQPRKIADSGIGDAVRGNVVVVRHKEVSLDDVVARFPADRYVAVDDKAVLLARMKERLGDRVSTVHVAQGHYGGEPAQPAEPAPDVAIPRIADLVPAVRTLLAVARPTGGGEMPQEAWTAKRERQYEHVKEDELERGRPARVAKRIAAATVNRTRTAKGETKARKKR